MKKQHNPISTKNQGFTKVPNEVLRSQKWNVYEKLIYSLLLSCGRTVFPSYSRLESWTNISRPTIWRTLRSLETKKAITRYINKIDQSVYYVCHHTNKPAVRNLKKKIKFTKKVLTSRSNLRSRDPP